MTLSVEFYEEVIASLGGTLVDVELTESDIDICFKKAVRTFEKKGHSNYRRLFYGLNVEKDKRTYDLPVRDINAETYKIDTIMTIIRPSRAMFSSEDAFSLAAYNDLMASRNTGVGGEVHLLTYELTLWLQEQHERYSAYGVQFNHDVLKNKIMFLTKPPANEVWILDCYVKLDEDELASLDWVIRWTIAEAKIMLGMAYNKFSSLSGPTGEFQIDGRSLIDGGNTDKQELLSEIDDFTDGAGDYMGITFG